MFYLNFPSLMSIFTYPSKFFKSLNIQWTAQSAYFWLASSCFFLLQLIKPNTWYSKVKAEYKKKIINIKNNIKL